MSFLLESKILHLEVRETKLSISDQDMTAEADSVD